MANLTGYSISQLGDFASAGGRIQPSDRFFTSENISKTSVYVDYLSKSLTYGDLVEQLFADLSAGFGFGSMAWESENDYSEVGHGHSYNTFDISARYEYDPDDEDEQASVVLASFRIGNRVVRLRMPRLWRYEDPDFEIGELKFKALNSIRSPTDIDINDSNFDGWVYPAGQTYDVAAGDFISAKSLFPGNTADGTTLRIPDLADRFVKAVPVKDKTIEKVEYSNTGVPRHTHATEASLSGSETSVAISAVATMRAGNGGYLHNGGNPDKQGRVCTGSLELSVTSLNITEAAIDNSSGELSREQYPPFRYLPVMIYIGKKNV